MAIISWRRRREMGKMGTDSGERYAVAALVSVSDLSRALANLNPRPRFFTPAGSRSISFPS
jgi:hypothetical protein